MQPVHSLQQFVKDMSNTGGPCQVIWNAQGQLFYLLVLSPISDISTLMQIQNIIIIKFLLFDIYKHYILQLSNEMHFG